MEEGKRRFAYNDKTGRQVSCRPEGNLSIGIGIDLETGLDDVEIDFLTRHRVELVEAALLKYPWYVSCDAVRKSVLLDIAFNTGVAGLLHFPHMISAIGRQDWATAQAQCHAQDPKLASRYAELGALLFKGADV